MEPFAGNNNYSSDDPYKYLFENTIKKNLEQYIYKNHPEPENFESPQIFSPNKKNEKPEEDKAPAVTTGRVYSTRKH